MTVGDIRSAIIGLPDDAPVFIIDAPHGADAHAVYVGLKQTNQTDGRIALWIEYAVGDEVDQDENEDGEDDFCSFSSSCDIMNGDWDDE